MTLYPLSLIGDLLKNLAWFSASSASPPTPVAEISQKGRSNIGVDKPEFLQLRDERIEEGVGPADIVFGPDLFDSRISETYAPYTDTFLDHEGKAGVADAEKPVSALFRTKDEGMIQDEMRKHLSHVRALRSQTPRD